MSHLCPQHRYKRSDFIISGAMIKLQETQTGVFLLWVIELHFNVPAWFLRPTWTPTVKDRDYSYTLPAVSSKSDNEETLTLWLTVEIRSSRRSGNMCLLSRDSHMSLWEWWQRPWPFEIISLDRTSGKPVRAAHEMSGLEPCTPLSARPLEHQLVFPQPAPWLPSSTIKRRAPEKESQIQLPPWVELSRSQVSAGLLGVAARGSSRFETPWRPLILHHKTSPVP